MLNGRPTSFAKGMDAVTEDVVQMGKIFAAARNEMGDEVFRKTDVPGLLESVFFVTPAMEMPILSNRPLSLRLFRQSLSIQIEFLDFLGRVAWDRLKCDRNPLSYYILFSQNQTAIEAFQHFANVTHSKPAIFAVNPPISARLAQFFDIDTRQTTLIASGRVFTCGFSPLDLLLIEIWLSRYISKPLTSLLDGLMYRRTNAVFYLTTILTDWKLNGIMRDSFTPWIWDLRYPVVYHSQRGLLNLDFVVDPFAPLFQRLADIIEFVQRNRVVDVRLVALSATNHSIPLHSFYRSCLKEDRAVFTMLNDSTTYSVLLDLPDSWVAESLNSVLDLDNVLLSALRPGLHKASYILTDLKVEGMAVASGPSSAEGMELALYDAGGVRRGDTLCIGRTAYWQFRAGPGHWTVHLGGPRSKLVYRSDFHHVIVASFFPVPRILQFQFNPGMDDSTVFAHPMPLAHNSSTI